jgi:TonB-linked SusC/RagA family outer membrane protein
VLLALLLSPAAAAAQDAVLTGRVQGSAMMPAAGAVISIPALNLTTVTNDAGQYRLVVPAAQARGQSVQVTVTLLGFEPAQATVTINAGATIRRDFQLTERAIALEQILVTGTAGQLERRAQSGVIASLNAAQVREVAPVQSVAQLLQSRVSSVSVQAASGVSGTAQTIRIRGAASVSLSNEPLVFIDGVRADARIQQIYGVGGQAGSRLNDIPPEDIESIEIVKGPAAATLYGADASAGVINIITRRGRAGQRFSQSVTAEYHTLDANYTPPSNWGVCTAAAVNRTTNFRGEPLTIETNPCLGQAVGTIVSDNPLVRTNVFRTGHNRLLTWTGRGGGEAYSYYVSLSTEAEDGTLPNNFYGRSGGQMNFDFLPRRDLRLEGGLGLTRTQTELPINDNNIYGYLGGGLLGSPITRGLASDGWFAANRQVEAIQAIQNLNTTVRIRPRLAAHYTPMEWFTNRLILGADLSRSSARSLFPRNEFNWYGVVDLNSGQVGEARQHYDVITLDYLGNITRRLTENIRTDLSFGTQYVLEFSDLTNATGIGLVTNAARAINAAARTTGGGSYSEEKSIGVFGHLQASFFDRFYGQFALRADRHSATGLDAGLFLSPTVGFSYVASDEPFIRGVLPELVSTLRLRARWGTTGRSPGTGALQTYSPAPFLVTPAEVGSGLVPGNPGNRELRPERGEEIEAGLDIGLFNERLGVEVTWFNKVSKDIVLSRPLAPSAGFTAGGVYMNIGEVVNQGIELSAVAQVIQRRDFAWEHRVAFNTLRNEVTDLGDVAPFGTLNRVESGMPLRAFVHRPILSVDTVANRVVVRDSMHFRGNLLPGFEGNTSATLAFFGIARLYAQLDWKHDFYIMNSTDQFRERQMGTGERWVRRNEILTAEERLRRFGPFFREDGSSIAAGNINEMYIEPGDFWRLREVSLTLQLPREWAALFRSQSASVTFAGRNLALWTDYTGADPEVNTSTSGIARSDFLTVPGHRRFVTRVNLQF